MLVTLSSETGKDTSTFYSLLATLALDLPKPAATSPAQSFTKFTSTWKSSQVDSVRCRQLLTLGALRFMGIYKRKLVHGPHFSWDYPEALFEHAILRTGL